MLFQEVRLVSIAALLLVAITCPSLCAARRPRTKPNVLLVVADDLGWSDLGYQGITKMKTPNIDRLAKGGVILENYYVQPVCTPTRAALLSGRYPIHTGMQVGVVKPKQPYGLPLEFKLLPQKLKEAGYSTHMVGKWHLGYYKWEYTPTYRGFDTFYGFYNDDEDHWTHERYGILDLRDQTAPVFNARDQYSAIMYAERAQQVIKAQDPATPMFMYLAFANMHEPLQAPKRFTDMYKHIKDEHRRIYAGMVSAVDEAVGNVTAALKKKGIWDNTLVIFTSDNGGVAYYGGYNWPLRGGKAFLWEGGVRGAAFVHGKMLKSKGRRCRELLHATDWYPTILGLAGVDTKKISPPLDGINVWNTISKGAPSPRKEILHNIDPPDEQPIDVPNNPYLPPGEGMAIRSGDWKLLENVLWFPHLEPPELKEGSSGSLGNLTEIKGITLPRVPVALYNITADPEERHNLCGRYPDVVKKLRQKIAEYKKTVRKSLKDYDDPVAYETAKKNGCWGPWRTSDENCP